MPRPEKVKFFENKEVAMIAAGGSHSFALLKPGNKILYGWGSGIYGEIGNGENNDSPLPKMVKTYQELKS